MNLNYLLIWIIAFWCASLVVWMTRIPFNQLEGWVIATAFILAVTIGIFNVNPDIAGLIGGSFWIILVLIPLTGMRKVNQLVSAGRYAEARKLIARLRWLHPADGWVEQPEILRALELGHRGEISEALNILNRYQTNNTPIGRNATILVYRMGSRWYDLIAWVRHNSPEKLLKDPIVLTYYLRALGETGDLNGLVNEFFRFERSLEKLGDSVTMNTIRMFVLAFCGQTEELKKLLYGPLAIFPESSRDFWLATAEMAAGNEALGREKLLALRNGSDISLQSAIAWRLSQPYVNAVQVLTESSQQALPRISKDFQHEIEYGRLLNLSGKKPYATYLIIGLNCLVFALEILTGGSQSLENLYRLGALSPEAVWNGEWWRVLSATFLHFGYLHLVMNMMGLYVLGSFVELSFGTWRYLISYFICGMGSMFTIAFLATSPVAQVQITVGASGAIMGLIGVMGAIMLWGWWREKSRIAAKRLQSIIWIVVLQAFFDLTTPQISILGHNSGLILGFLTGNLLLIGWRRKG